MSNVSAKTTIVAVRLPNELLARVDAAKGSRTSVIISALESCLDPVKPVTRDPQSDKAA